ncbi:MAG: hypothetical protein ACTSRP_21450, partial [Candidatus Helarchaeota archaeon]
IRIKEGRIDIIKMISKKIVEFWLYILLLIIPVILGVSCAVYVICKWVKKRRNEKMGFNLKKQTIS